jgi:hypothetical protein
MPYFSVRHYPDMPLTVVSVTDRRPQRVAKDGLVLIHCAQVSHEAAVGAEKWIDGLDRHMGSRRKHRGIYQVRVQEIMELYELMLEENADRPVHSMPARIAAGIVAVALLFLMCAIAVPMGIFWLAVCAFKHQSGLRAMAETAVMFSIFDWSRPIEKLARIARYGK